jgi:hypothetical protein
LGKLLYRVRFRDEDSPRFWAFDTAAAAHDWVGRRHPGRDHVVRTEPINPFLYQFTLRPSKERLCRPPAPITAVVIAFLVFVSLSGAVSGRADDVRMRANVPRPDRAVAQCKDGTYSETTEFWNTCRSAFGVKQWLAPNVLCRDGRIIELNERTSCGSAGFDRLLTEKETSSAPVATTVAKFVSFTTTTAAREATVAPPPAAAAPPATNSCSATVSNARPSRGTTTTVSVTSNQATTPVQIAIIYRTTTMTQSATTDSTGRANVVVPIGAATIGYTVDVTVAVGPARCSTAFTPAA